MVVSSRGVAGVTNRDLSVTGDHGCPLVRTSVRPLHVGHLWVEVWVGVWVEAWVGLWVGLGFVVRRREIRGVSFSGCGAVGSARDWGSRGRRFDPGHPDVEPDPYTRGYMQGVADAGARLIGCVAAELGHDHPLVDRMVRRLGSLSTDVEEGEDHPDDGAPRDWTS